MLPEDTCLLGERCPFCGSDAIGTSINQQQIGMGKSSVLTKFTLSCSACQTVSQSFYFDGCPLYYEKIVCGRAVEIRSARMGELIDRPVIS